MKKITALLLTIAFFATAIISVVAVSFKDIPEDAYYKDAAVRMSERGILSGYGDGFYYGEESVTRAQIAALVCKMLGKTKEAESLAGKTDFKDVNEDGWYTGYINYAVANGIIVGDGDGNFRPDDYVKYEEVVKVIVCVLDLDDNIKINPSDWSAEYIEIAEEAGLLKGLAGKKGTPMMRSDIAVICDLGVAVLDKAEAAAETTTTKKSTNRPISNKPEDTTKNEEVTTEPTVETTTEQIPEETTESTTTVLEEPVETEETRENALPGFGFGK